MTGINPVLRSAGLTATFLLLLTGCAKIESYVSGDPAEKEYQAATKLPPLEIPPEMVRGNVAGSDALLIPGVDENDGVVYSARRGAVSTGQKRQQEAISFINRDESGLTTLRISGGTATAWNEVRGAVAKLGIKVNHLNRERGTFEIAYPLVGELERGLVDRLAFWNNDDVPMVDVKLVIENLGEPTTLVRAYDGNELDNSLTATAALESIHRQLSPEVATAASAQPSTTTPVNTARQFVAESSSNAVTAPVVAEGFRYRLEKHAGGSRLITSQDFPRTWREVGMAIANESLEIEDRDRSRGLYFVADQAAVKQSGGILKKMKFWGSDEPEMITRLIAVQPIATGGNQVLIFDEDKKLDSSVGADALLGRLLNRLR